MANLGIVASEVLSAGAELLDAESAAVAVAAGEAVYFDATSRQYRLAQCDGTEEEAVVVGLAAWSVNANQPLRLISPGSILTAGATAAPVEGTIYLLSQTPGKLMPAADILSTNRVVVLAVGLAADQLFFQPMLSTAVAP